MKKILTFLLFSLVGLICFAQNDLQILSNEKTIGKNFKANNEIKAKEFIFPERIFHSYIDTTSNLLTIQLRGVKNNGKYYKNKGKLVLYDLLNKSTKWVEKINYNLDEIKQFDNIIIKTRSGESSCLNIENGKELWDVKNAIYYVDAFQKLGLGYKYKFSTGYTNILEGINLRNGKPIWEREINREYGWNNLFHLNDSTILITAAGLHSINLNNGKGWDFNAITGDADYTGAIVANAAGLALGILTGTFVYTTGHQLVSDIVSNVIVDSLNIYFASKENISRLNREGNVVWSYKLPNKSTSKSTIFKRDSLIYMVNRGYAFMGYRQLNFGDPFIAAFNINSGEQLFLSKIKGKNDQIIDSKIQKDTILLVFKDRVSKYSILDGSLISEKTFDNEKLGVFQCFIGNNVFIKSDSTFNSLVLNEPNRYYIYTDKDKVIVINNQFEILDQIDFAELYIRYLIIKDLEFVAKKNETVIIDSKGNKVAEIIASKNAILMGTKLYDVQEKSFIEIDLNGLLNN